MEAHQHSCSCGCSHEDTHEHSHEHNHEHAHEHEHAQEGKWGRVCLGLALAAFAAGFFLPEQWAWPAYLSAYLLTGWPILMLAGRNLLRGRVMDENSLMSLATIGAWAVGEPMEAALVMLLYRIGEALQDKAAARSRQAIAALTDIRPALARLVSDNGSFMEIPPEQVQPGQVLQVRPGERLPVDGIIVSGTAHLDMSALTGESLPVAVAAGQTVRSGAVDLDGMLMVEAQKSYADSAVAQILRLLEQSAAHKAPAESMIRAFARRYTPLVTLAAALLFLIPTIMGGAWQVWLYRAMVFLAASCPCAFIISVPLTYFAGLGAAAKAGALIKGGNYLAALPAVRTVVFDKTGTLTEGRFAVTEIIPAPPFSRDELLRMAARAEAASNHPLAQAVVTAYRESSGEAPLAAENLREQAGMGLIAQVEGQQVLVGNARLLAEHGLTVAEEGKTLLHVAVDGVYAGHIVARDSIKATSASAIAELKSMGVRRTVMLSGDSPAHAQSVADTLGLSEAEGGLLPGDKVERLRELIAGQGPKEKLLFMGDGINDAPSLALADIGVAMGGVGAEAAAAAADIVLLRDDPLQLTQAMRIARRTNNIARQNIAFSMIIKLAVLVTAVFGISGMTAAVFADVGVALIAVANAMRAAKV